MNTRHLFPYTLSRAPTAVRQAKLDTIALVPASFLSVPARKQQYTTIAKHLPRGSVLLCPPPYAKQKKPW